MKLTHQERVKRLRNFIKDGLLIRDHFTGQTDDGRQTACLLAAMSPEVAKRESPSSCPAKVMPPWFAELTPCIDDYGSVDKWHPMVLRYAKLAQDWDRLDQPAWHRLHAKAMRIGLQRIAQVPEHILATALEYWGRPDDISSDVWARLRAEAGKACAASQHEKRRLKYGAMRSGIERTIYGLEAIQEVSHFPVRASDVCTLWFKAIRSHSSNSDEQKECFDALTDDLFDALQIEIDKAKASN